MHANVGDSIRIRGRVVGQPDRRARIIEVHGKDGAPPYLVRADNGEVTLVLPGSDCTIETPQGLIRS
ncbi:MAG TPA: DUF1918 domain-containing protein [Candidatus Stackebrandtia faecavium]|nr:DUF1918 domain-containing protein [Candidatus Stackebrandtia faecavium]